MSHSSGSPSSTTAPTGWVPADRRWAGLDRRSIGPALLVLGFALLLRFGFPGINDAIPYDDPVRSGDMMSLLDGVTFAPATGWNIVQGVRVGVGGASTSTAEALLTNGDVSFHVKVGPFSGSSRALVAQVKETTDALNNAGDVHVTGDPVAITTDSGLDGMVVRYSSPTITGVLAAFVVDGVGIQVDATGAGDLSEEAVRDVASMIASLRVAERGAA